MCRMDDGEMENDVNAENSFEHQNQGFNALQLSSNRRSKS